MSGHYDATASMLGYLFQMRLALLESLRRLQRSGTFTVTIELFDDVAFQSTGSPIELFQTKHHVNRQGSLTDASPDIWKSIRIWAEAFKEGRWGSDAVHYLVTTTTAASGSAASYLRTEERNVAAAVSRLDAIQQTSTSETNEKSYAAYGKLTGPQRHALLDRVVVADRSPDIGDLDIVLRQLLVFAAGPNLVGAFVTRLEGWWFQRVIEQLRSPTRPILSEELDAELGRLRQQFKDDNLPIDADLLAYDAIDADSFKSQAFVEQLRMIDINAKRLLNAMRQYFRASEQRSRWLRDGFLHLGELDKYDRRLCEEWDIRFSVMAQELGEVAAEDAMRTAARKLYEWAELESTLFIRPACTEPFVSRGSLQVLADYGRVGWHPQYALRIHHLVREVL